MNLMKCSKGHYYDGDKYSQCPFCNGAGTSSGGDSVTVAMPSSSTPTDVTVALPSSGSDPVTMMSSSSPDPVTMMSSNSPDPVTQKSYKTGVTEMGTVDSTLSGLTPPSLPDDNVTTVSYYDQIMDEPASAEPVVGWLVCTSGQYFGQSFPLKAGRNFIGRSPQMDVCLSGENSVSRDRHAVIIYEPRGRLFIAQPGDSRELFYLNDKVVLDNEKLKAYDCLSIGKVDMMLMPFCSDTFAWEDLEKDKTEEKKKIELKKTN